MPAQRRNHLEYEIAGHKHSSRVCLHNYRTAGNPVFLSYAMAATRQALWFYKQLKKEV